MGKASAGRTSRAVGGWLLAVGWWLWALGCAGGYDAQTSLRNSVDEFHEGFRWGAMGSMIPHVPSADRGTFAVDYEARMDGVSMADYEVSRVVIAEDSQSARVWVRLAWFRASEMELREAVVREEWLRDGSNWLRTEFEVERGELP